MVIIWLLLYGYYMVIRLFYYMANKKNFITTKVVRILHFY